MDKQKLLSSFNSDQESASDLASGGSEAVLRYRGDFHEKDEMQHHEFDWKMNQLLRRGAVRHKTNRLNVLFFRRLLILNRMIFSDGWTKFYSMWQVVVATLALSLISLYFQSNSGNVPGLLLEAIIDDDRKAFTRSLARGTLYICGWATFEGGRKAMEEYLGLRIRQRLTHLAHTSYLHRLTFYKILNLDERIDNPDQRITQDVSRFADAWGEIISKTVDAPLRIVFYTFSIFVKLDLGSAAAIYVYFLIVFVINTMIIHPIVKMVCFQEELEGNFRFAHVWLRTNAESIAFYGGAREERGIVNRALDWLIANTKRIVLRHYILYAATFAGSEVGDFMKYAVVAFAAFYGTRFDSMDPGKKTRLVSQSAFVCAMLGKAFQHIYALAKRFSDLAGYTARVAEFVEVVEDLESDTAAAGFGGHRWTQRPPPSVHGSRGFDSSGFVGQVVDAAESVAFRSVEVATPKGRMLVKDLTFELPPGKNLLIAGPSGTGKTSLLRAVCGLWPIRAGTIARPPPGACDMLYLPQNTYTVLGTLRRQVIYPRTRATADDGEDERIADALQCALLDHLPNRVGGLDAEQDWSDLLSPGEKQRLALARLFFHAPRLAVLDESTSAIDVEAEEAIYAKAKERGIAYISVGHRESLEKFHDFRLVLQPDSSPTWVVQTLAHERQ